MLNLDAEAIVLHLAYCSYGDAAAASMLQLAGCCYLLSVRVAAGLQGPGPELLLQILTPPYLLLQTHLEEVQLLPERPLHLLSHLLQLLGHLSLEHSPAGLTPHRLGHRHTASDRHLRVRQTGQC